ncbi:MAG TPA: MBL fold metallo-hydrolase [Rhodanobacteraceae bacterium]|nr:MBL fold metallo-hydrolase [Rhodanobacteraceae bacterium]
MTDTTQPAGPRALATLHPRDGIAVLRSAMPLPDLGGQLANNAFVFDGREPMLVDTGFALLREDMLAALAAEIDPRRLRRIFLSHADADHVGNLAAVLELAPEARVLTGFLGYAKLMLTGFPVDRVQVIAPGDTLDLGDRRLSVLRPPYYDAPETLGFHDAASDTLFVVDAFGAVLPAITRTAEQIDDDALDRGLETWSQLDAPWLASLDRAALEASLAALSALAPRLVLGAHLPPALDVDALIERILRLHARGRAPALRNAA